MLRLVALLLMALAVHSTAAETTVTLLATTDLHGYLMPVDYFTAKTADRGLAKIATLISEARASNPHTLLIDCGDTIQGSPLEYVYQTFRRTGEYPLHLKASALAGDPMMLSMNALRYDAMVLGNHEFNYGLKNLNAARAEARFPWLSANTSIQGAGKPFAPYIVKDVGGVKVAIVGITTPVIPQWEKPENIAGYTFRPGVSAAREAVAAVRAKEHPDLVILAAHAGIDRAGGDENMVYQIAQQIPDLDAIVYGHTHLEVPEERVGEVLLVQPKNWGMSLARIDFTLERESGGPWKVRSKQSRTFRAGTSVTPDPAIVRIAQPYHDITERYLSTPIAESAAAMDGRLARVEDTPILDAVQNVQLHYAKADVSFASMFNPSISIPKGAVTVRQIAGLYVYDNELYVMEGDGAMVKAALENAARYFLQCGDAACNGPLINPKVFGFNYDVAQGVSYDIDLTRPAGNRIVNLQWRGKPLEPSQKLRIAVNNYRAGGSAGYDVFRQAKIVWRSNEEIRDMIIRYYIEHRQMQPVTDQNWRIVPEAARRNLEKAAREFRPSAM